MRVSFPLPPIRRSSPEPPINVLSEAPPRTSEAPVQPLRSTVVRPAVRTLTTRSPDTASASCVRLAPAIPTPVTSSVPGMPPAATLPRLSSNTSPIAVGTVPEIVNPVLRCSRVVMRAGVITGSSPATEVTTVTDGASVIRSLPAASVCRTESPRVVPTGSNTDAADTPQGSVGLVRTCHAPGSVTPMVTVPSALVQSPAVPVSFRNANVAAAGGVRSTVTVPGSTPAALRTPPTVWRAMTAPAAKVPSARLNEEPEPATHAVPLQCSQEPDGFRPRTSTVGTFVIPSLALAPVSERSVRTGVAGVVRWGDGCQYTGGIGGDSTIGTGSGLSASAASSAAAESGAFDSVGVGSVGGGASVVVGKHADVDNTVTSTSAIPTRRGNWTFILRFPHGSPK